MRVDVEDGVCLTVAEFEGSFALASEDLDVDVAETDLALFVWFVFKVLFLFPPPVMWSKKRSELSFGLASLLPLFALFASGDFVLLESTLPVSVFLALLALVYRCNTFGDLNFRHGYLD